MFFYRIPSANEALVITGRKSKQDQFRILTGKGDYVFPVFSKAKSLSLDILEAQLNEPCVTKQGIQLGVQAVAVFKVGNDDQSISNAARRFMDKQNTMQGTVGQVLAGHLRSIVGGMTVEEIIQDRNALASQVKDSSSDEMENMGLTIDSFQIREIADPANYIGSMAQVNIAEVEKKARIATAQADQAATEQEQLAVAAKAGFARDAQIAQAEADGKAQAAKAQADQQGPLAEANAQQAVQVANAELAKKKAEVTEADLDSQVRRPADAKKYEAVTTAEGEAQATRARADASKYQQVAAAEADRDATIARSAGAEAEAKRITVVAEADARATQVKNDALASGNLERQVATQFVEIMPDVVKGLADGLRGSNLTIMNGMDGVGEIFGGLVKTGRVIYDQLVKESSADSSLGTGGPAETAGRALDKVASRGSGG